jgi:hypothetical protein
LYEKRTVLIVIPGICLNNIILGIWIHNFSGDRHWLQKYMCCKSKYHTITTMTTSLQFVLQIYISIVPTWSKWNSRNLSFQNTRRTCVSKKSSSSVPCMAPVVYNNSKNKFIVDIPNILYENNLNSLNYIPWSEIWCFERIGFYCSSYIIVSFIGGENHRPVASHWQSLSHIVVSSTPRLRGTCRKIKTFESQYCFTK